MSNTLLHAAQGPTMVTSESKHRCKSSISTAVERRNQGMLLAIHPEIVATHMEAAASLGWSLYHANHAADGTLPSELPQVTRKSTTTETPRCSVIICSKEISRNFEYGRVSEQLPHPPPSCVKTEDIIYVIHTVTLLY